MENNRKAERQNERGEGMERERGARDGGGGGSLWRVRSSNLEP
jgi:hypothetical protein